MGEDMKGEGESGRSPIDLYFCCDAPALLIEDVSDLDHKVLFAVRCLECGAARLHLVAKDDIVDRK
jgi:hypothetical protein